MGLSVFQASKALSAFFLNCIFKDIHIANSLSGWKVTSRAKSTLTAHYKIFGIQKTRVFSNYKTHYVNRCLASPQCPMDGY